jgi:VWFA-related protein
MPRISLTVLSTGVACLAVVAQAPQPTFRAGVEYVELDAVVTDTQDKPVKDLTKENFEVLERGRPQTLAGFQFVSIHPSRRTVPDVKTAAPSIDVVSNAHAPLGRQWVLVIDDLHIIEQHIVHTKKVVQEFLESLPADDQVAIVFVGRSDLSQDFTSDLGAQMRTVNRIRDALGFAYDAADRGGGSAVERVSAADRHKYGMGSIDVLNNVSKALTRSTYPRKALVYVSEGMTYPDELPADPIVRSYVEDFLDGLHGSFDVARRAGVPVYTIDPRGAPDCTAVRGDCVEPPWPNIRNQWNHLRELADNTGGRAFVNRSDILQAVHDLVDDSNSFYLLGYYPEPLERDGKFHDVDVTIKGRTGLKVRARAGYTSPKPAKTTEADTRLTLDGVLSAALPVASLQLRATAAPIAVGEKGMVTAVTLEVTYPALADTKFDDTLLFGMIALDRDGKVKASMRGTYSYTATPNRSIDTSYTVNATIDLPSQPLTLRIGVASRALDRAASIHVPVEAINPSRDVLQIGAIVLGFAGPPRQAAVPPGAFKGLVPIQPSTSRAFVAADTLQLFAPCFWRTADATALVTIAIRRGDQIVLTARADLPGEALNSRTVSRGKQAALNATLPLKSLAPGAYVLEVTGRLTSGSIARRSVAFEIK